MEEKVVELTKQISELNRIIQKAKLQNNEELRVFACMELKYYTQKLEKYNGQKLNGSLV